jgi:hypothetical protein
MPGMMITAAEITTIEKFKRSIFAENMDYLRLNK